MKDFEEISEKNPFKVPAGYFEELDQKIISSTSGDGTRIQKTGLYVKMRPWLAVAASVAVLTILSFLVIHIISSSNSRSDVPQISIIEFTDNYLDDIDILTLEEKAESIEPDIAGIDINSKDIIDYLVFENIEINELHEIL